MSEKLAKIESYINKELDVLAEEIDEINERHAKGFDPMDWSGVTSMMHIRWEKTKVTFEDHIVC